MPLLSTFGAASARSFGGIGAAAAGAGLDIDEVFSTFVYDGNATAKSINNGIDLTEGGLVWTKERSDVRDHQLYDTARGADKALESSDTIAQHTGGAGVVSFNSNGFSLGVGSRANSNGEEFVSWTFRQAPRFFDVVKYDSSSGNVTNFGSAGATVDHNLGSVPGMIIVKCTDTGSTNWKVYHRGLNGGTNPEQYEIELNQTGTEANSANSWNDTAPTSTQFTLGASGDVNNGSRSYVAYLFAHNNSDGGFGPDADQDVVKCGSFVNNSSSVGVEVDLGFEPQFLLIKGASSGSGLGHWILIDNMRGASVDSQQRVYANKTNAEGSTNAFKFTSRGFTPNTYYDGTLIYMAIRRGPLAAPEDATKVFALGTRGASTPGFTSNFPVDMFIRKYTNSSGYPDIGSRLTGAKAMQTSENFAEGNDSSSTFDHMNGYYNSSSADSNHFSWMWKRAPSYFDVCCYIGAGAAQTVNHNLGVVPEMMWIKNRDSAENWAVYHSALGTSKYLHLNTNDAALTLDAANRWNNTSPTATQFSVGTSTEVSHFTRDFVAYLFATVAGVSKVGSYTGSGSDQTIDCGFTNGARFVLIKVTSDSDNWVLFDTTRGLVAGNDALLSLNLTHAQVTNLDYIDPHSSGFAVPGNDLATNKSGETYIFYAISA